MKAWIVIYDKYDLESYAIYCHAETRGKAKSRAQRIDPGYDFTDSHFTELIALRLPAMDSLPFTNENMDLAGIEFFDPETGCFEKPRDLLWQYVNDCDCEICKQYEKSQNCK